MVKFQEQVTKSSTSENLKNVGKTSIPPIIPSNMPPIMPPRDLENGLTNILTGGLKDTLNESKDLIQNASAKELDDLQNKLESAEKLLKDKANEKKPNVTESVNDNMV